MIDAATKAMVRQRAGNRCEYCRLAAIDSPLASLHIEHIVAKKHLGSDQEANLALACVECNLHKGSNLSGLDPSTGQLTRLFHPRMDVWDDHFEWVGSYLAGRTEVGRTTVQVLDMNSEFRLDLRSS